MSKRNEVGIPGQLVHHYQEARVSPRHWVSLHVIQCNRMPRMRWNGQGFEQSRSTEPFTFGLLAHTAVRHQVHHILLHSRPSEQASQSVIGGMNARVAPCGTSMNGMQEFLLHGCIGTNPNPAFVKNLPISNIVG